MTESAEPSARFDFSAKDDSRIPSEDEEETKKKKSLGKKGMSTAVFPKMFRFRGKRSVYKDAALSELLQGIESRRYTYRELHTATQGFSDACNIWGEEGWYVMYKGMLEGQRAVAIKLLSTSDYIVDMYIAEVKTLSEVRHRNVVRLLGRCHDAGHLALVFELMPNLSLVHHLLGYTDRPPLPWKVRYSTIAVGIASALLYLHDGLEHCVKHRSIKPSNIWLDSDFNPKIADFSHSTVTNGDDLELNGVFGTLGYLDPQCLLTGHFGSTSDIYSFGVVALQIASGRKAYEKEGKYLAEWVQELYKEGRLLEAVDPKLSDDFNEREVERLLLTGLRCTQFDPKSRPSAKMILQLLNFQAPMPSNFISSVKCNVDDIVERVLWSPSSTLSISVDSIPADCLDDATNYKHGEDNDATTISTENLIDRGEFKDDGDDDRLLPILVQDVGKYELLSEQTMYNIGIPPNFGSAEITNHRKDHHHHIFKGLVGSLREMMRSEENLPPFDEALKKIKMYTDFLVQEIGPPLDDWDTLAQLVLQALKEREDLFKSCDDQESLVAIFTVPSLDVEHTLKEDEEKLEDVKECLARARQRCSDLVAELAEAQEISLSTEAEMEAMEQTIAEKRALLVQRRRHRAFLEHYQIVLSKLSSFAC